MGEGSGEEKVNPNYEWQFLGGKLNKWVFGIKERGLVRDYLAEIELLCWYGELDRWHWKVFKLKLEKCSAGPKEGQILRLKNVKKGAERTFEEAVAEAESELGFTLDWSEEELKHWWED